MSSNKIQQIKTQIEYYLSDKNLETDSFFHDLLSNSKDHYIFTGVLLNCNKIKKLTTDINDIIAAIELSELFTLSKDKIKFKRNKEELPELKLLGKKRENEEKEQEKEAETMNEKDEIIIYRIKASCSTELKWKQIQDEIINSNPGLEIDYLRFSNDSGHLGVFKSKVDKLKKLDFSINDTNIQIIKAEGDSLIDFWKCHGNHIDMCLGKMNKKKDKKGKDKYEKKHEDKKEKPEKDKHDKHDKTKTKLSKPVQLGTMKFLDTKDIRQKARSILNNIQAGQKPQHHEEKFLKDILTYHPNSNKGNDLDYFTTGQNPDYSGSKCFLIVKTDGTTEDFSINKCLDTIQEKFGI